MTEIIHARVRLCDRSMNIRIWLYMSLHISKFDADCVPTSTAAFSMAPKRSLVLMAKKYKNEVSDVDYERIVQSVRSQANQA